MWGFSIIDIIVDLLTFSGWKDVSYKDKWLWIIKYPLFVFFALFFLAYCVFTITYLNIKGIFRKKR